MQVEQVQDNRYKAIDKAVGDMAGGTVKLRHLVYALVAFGTPLLVGIMAMNAVG